MLFLALIRAYLDGHPARLEELHVYGGGERYILVTFMENGKEKYICNMTNKEPGEFLLESLVEANPETIIVHNIENFANKKLFATLRLIFDGKMIY